MLVHAFQKQIVVHFALLAFKMPHPVVLVLCRLPVPSIRDCVSLMMITNMTHLYVLRTRDASDEVIEARGADGYEHRPHDFSNKNRFTRSVSFSFVFQSTSWLFPHVAFFVLQLWTDSYFRMGHVTSQPRPCKHTRGRSLWRRPPEARSCNGFSGKILVRCLWAAQLRMK